MMPPEAGARLPPVEIQVQSPLWNKEPDAADTVRAAIAAAAETLSTGVGEVSIVLTDDSQIQILNREWRGVDSATNVLSFPAAKAAGGRILGDIVIAYETLKRECDNEGRVFLHHLAHLSVHGFLHLLGYDHANDTEADAMEALERKILTRMQMPDPYLERDLR